MNLSRFLTPLLLLALSIPFLPSLYFSSSQSYCFPMDLSEWVMIPVDHFESFDTIGGAVVHEVVAVVSA